MARLMLHGWDEGWLVGFDEVAVWLKLPLRLPLKLPAYVVVSCCDVVMCCRVVVLCDASRSLAIAPPRPTNHDHPTPAKHRFTAIACLFPRSAGKVASGA